MSLVILSLAQEIVRDNAEGPAGIGRQRRAAQLILERRVTALEWVNNLPVSLRIRPSVKNKKHVPYRLTYGPNKGWFCDCPDAMRHDRDLCKHARAGHLLRAAIHALHNAVANGITYKSYIVGIDQLRGQVVPKSYLDELLQVMRLVAVRLAPSPEFPFDISPDDMQVQESPAVAGPEPAPIPPAPPAPNMVLAVPVATPAPADELDAALDRFFEQ